MHNTVLCTRRYALNYAFSYTYHTPFFNFKGSADPTKVADPDSTATKTTKCFHATALQTFCLAKIFSIEMQKS